ncbi:MAG: peptidase M14 [Planctomycetes bacterium]|nr:peptidase M14 [Planctomycetota bacterium]
MRASRFSCILTLLALSTPVAGVAEEVTTPEEHLGRPVGVDFQLADWNEVKSYFRKLARQSPNVITEKVGTTTEGRDFLLSTISSAENLARLDAIRRSAKTIADPRGKTKAEKKKAVREGKVILFISCAMHATETAAPQFAMQFAYELATAKGEPWRSARRNLVVVIAPSANPDGLDHVVSWYRKTVGTPYEASSLLKLYQYYTGHDNNRDWFMLTHAETRIVTEQLYSVWFPHVCWDVHQQGSDEERMFVPPFRDPLNPNLDPAIISGIDLLGTRGLMDMTREGLSGISTGVSYDMWWNGGNRNVPVRHNIVGLLTEGASVNIASPIFLPRSKLSSPLGEGKYGPSNQFPLPWPGGWWRLADVIDYELAFGRSLLGSLAREPRLWLANSLEAAERAIQKGKDSAPNAWLIPSDNRDRAAVERLVGALLPGGVEVHVATEEVSADGRQYPAGTIVIRRDQPYGSYVKDLLDVQRYPEGKPPYDVSGWTLSALLGVRRVEVMHGLEADLKLVTSAEEAVAGFAGDPRVGSETPDALSSWNSHTWTAVIDRLQQGSTVRFVTEGPQQGLFLPGPKPAKKSKRKKGDDRKAPDEAAILVDSMPRVGLYSPWRGNMDEGWMRYVLDTYKVPYTTVRNEMLRAGNLADFLDVLIIPSVSASQLDAGRSPGSLPDQYAGGLAPEGAVAVEEFVRTGGTLITLGSSSRWAVELLELPLVDVTAASGAKEFSCPGSVLRGIPDPDHPLTAGLPSSMALFFSRSAGWRTMTDDEKKKAGQSDERKTETLLEYASTRLLLSGWISRPEVIEGQSAWVRAPHGQGRVHLFGFRPHYRAWSQATFPLLFRAMLLDGGPEKSDKPEAEDDG